MSSNTILIGEKYADRLEKPLERLGFEPLYVPDNPDVDERLSGHVDLSVFYDGEKRLYLAPFLKSSELVFQLKKLGFSTIFPKFLQNSSYPQDAQMNIRSFGNTCIYSEKVSCREIVDTLALRGLTMIPVRQGYCGCSVCAVDERSIITADPGIHRTVIAHGLDSLLIRPGHIVLDGFEYGFLGGATFMLSETQLAFTGVLRRHPDEEKILDFLKNHGKEPVFLTDEPIFDIGSAIPLT